MGKTIVYQDDARKKLLSGVASIAKAVKVTLGPSGKNVLIRRKGDQAPFATKDGVTVAAEITSDDYIEQIAIEAIQEVAVNADNSAGDGTTTATILAEAIFDLGSKKSEEGVNLLDLKKGIDIGVAEIVSRLKSIALPCDDLEKLKEVAMVSSNNDKEVSDIVVDAFKVAGKQGVVNIKRSTTKDTYLTTIEGMNLPTGYVSTYFMTDHGNDIVELDKPYVYITNEKISTITDNLNNLLKIVAANQYSLLIICKDIDPSVLGVLVQGKVDGVLKTCVCKAPEFGQEQVNLLTDLGVMLGKQPFLEKTGIAFDEIVVPVKSIEGGMVPVDQNDLLKYLPRSEAVVVSKNSLSLKGPIDITDDVRKQIDLDKTNRADKIRSEITKDTNQYEKGLMQTRISRLTDGIAYINIGAISEIEFIEKQHRIQDALYGVKSASEEGIVPGGGTALVYVSKARPIHKNSSINLGIEVVFEAVKEPFFQILENVGISATKEEFSQIESSFDYGINARTQEFTKSMISNGIIDPVKVTRVALENAASVAGMLLTTDCVVIDNEAYEKIIQPNY